MKKIILVEIPITICVSFTLITLIVSTSMSIKGHETLPIFTGYTTLICCTIAVITLYGQKLLSSWPTLLVMCLQYAFAVLMIVLFVFIISLFEPIHPDGYKDTIRTFTPFFLLGAVVYYISHFIEVKNQNRLLQDAKSNR